MANSPYLKSSGAASATGGAGGPIRGSNASLPGSGYAGIQGSLDFNTGWGAYGGVGPLQTAEGGGIPGGHRSSRIEPRYRPY
jgi:hypothetical protein